MRAVVIDADVLGRQRTGDETYVRNLLAELPQLAAAKGLRFAAVTRNPELVPDGVESLPLSTSVQELRMAWALPRALRRVGAALCHTQYALPLRAPCPCVVTVHDASFARQPELMSWKDRLVFRRMVPRALRTAARVLTVSERTKGDLVELYDADPARIVVTPNGVDPIFRPHAAAAEKPRDTLPLGSYVLAVGAIQKRKNQLAALEAATAAGFPLVVVGPEKDATLADELRRKGARVEGYVEPTRLAALYRDAVCLVQTSTYEGFGLPVLEAMASGTPVVALREPALVEVGDAAAVFVDEARLADGIREALADRDRLVAAGLEHARTFSWRRTAERTLEVYLEVLDG
jgi:glycosyltransferase involved in cell wall biosynthesis